MAAVRVSLLAHRDAIDAVWDGLERLIHRWDDPVQERGSQPDGTRSVALASESRFVTHPRSDDEEAMSGSLHVRGSDGMEARARGVQILRELAPHLELGRLEAPYPPLRHLPEVPLLAQGLAAVASPKWISIWFQDDLVPPDGVAWEQIGGATFASRLLDVHNRETYETRALPQNMALWFQARPGYSIPPSQAVAPCPPRPPSVLQAVGYDPGTGEVEYAADIAVDVRVTWWEIAELAAQVRSQCLSDGREIRGVRVVFSRVQAALANSVPLVDCGVRVLGYTEDGDEHEVQWKSASSPPTASPPTASPPTASPPTASPPESHDRAPAAPRGPAMFFAPGGTRCALTGRVLHERCYAGRLRHRVPALFEALAEPGSEWVDRVAFERWDRRAAWVRQSTAFALAAYADGPHQARHCADGLLRIGGAHGGALLDLSHLWSLDLTGERAQSLRIGVHRALGGASSEVDLGAEKLMLSPGGQLTSVGRDGELIETGILPRARLVAWAAALGDGASTGPVPTFTGEGSVHRLGLSPSPAGGAAALIGRLGMALDAIALTTGQRLQVLGGHDCHGGVQLFLAGDLLPWRVLAQRLRISPAPLHGLAGNVHIESRELDFLAELRRDGRPWPIAFQGGGEVCAMRAHGWVSPGQLRLLADHLDAALGAGLAEVVQSGVDLCRAVPTEPVLEAVILWAQRAWVEPQVIEAR